jgi:hypothetical protein
LPDCDCWRDSVDKVGVRLIDAFQELPSVSGERFDVAALSLGVDGVEGEGRLAGPGDSRDYGQSVMGNIKIDVLEVMSSRTANNYGFRRHL